MPNLLILAGVPRDDHYSSPFGAAYSAYMERPWLSRAIARLAWGADIAPYYRSMDAIGEVPAGGTVVDCPCGAGPAFGSIPNERTIRYVAADLSPSMLRRARRRVAAKRLEGVELVEADATALPLATDGADLFLSFWGLHCFERPEAALVEAARVLRPGGRLLGCCFALGNGGRRARRLLRPGWGGFGPIGTETEIVGWLAAAGFEPTIERSGPVLFFDAPSATG